MKTEVISKAQKIIERLSIKSESDEHVLKRMSDENDCHKKEANEKQKIIQMLNEQLSQMTARQSHDHAVMQETMT